MSDNIFFPFRYIQVVKRSREKTSEVYPFPPMRDCIRFAMTETAEVDDVLIRMETPAYKRNNHRDGDLFKELGQVGYMICSALIQSNILFTDESKFFIEENNGVEDINTVEMLYYMLAASLVWKENALDNLAAALLVWSGLCEKFDFDAQYTLEQACKFVEDKHLIQPAVCTQ